jgi:hypothetical protein
VVVVVVPGGLVACFSSGGGFCRGEGGEVLWYCLSWLWCFCPVVLERVRRVDTPC